MLTTNDTDRQAALGALVKIFDETKDAANDAVIMHYAAEVGHENIVKALIDAGADKNTPDNAGKTPYDAATTQEIKDLLKP